MRTRAIAIAAVLAALLAGCTPATRAHDGPLVIPQGLAWRYAASCMEPAIDVGVESLLWSNSGADVDLLETDDPDVDIAGLEAQIEECLRAYRYEEAVATSTDPYVRERLYEYYTAVTIPCLARQGIELEPLPRSIFVEPDGGEPWNPYLGMALPFDRVLELYQACPPEPASLHDLT